MRQSQARMQHQTDLTILTPFRGISLIKYLTVFEIQKNSKFRRLFCTSDPARLRTSAILICIRYSNYAMHAPDCISLLCILRKADTNPLRSLKI